MFLSNPYNLYYNYNVLKLHFTTEQFDYFKYFGKSKSFSEESFKTKSRETKLFYRLSEMLEEEISMPFFVAQIVYNSKAPKIGNIVKEPIKAQEYYNAYKENNKNILGNLMLDIRTIAKNCKDWREAIIRTDNDVPMLYKLTVQKQIRIESYVLLNDLFKQTKSIEDDSNAFFGIFNSMNLKYRKYRNFLDVTKEDILKVVPRYLN